MRVVEKSALNELITQGEERLKAEKKKVAGLWDYYYKPDIFDQLIIELEVLRKELEAKTIEVREEVEI